MIGCRYCRSSRQCKQISILRALSGHKASNIYPRALMIRLESKPLKEELHSLNAILDNYIDSSKNMSIVSKMRYALVDLEKLLGIQSNLTRSRTNFGLMVDLINSKAHKQHART